MKLLHLNEWDLGLQQRVCAYVQHVLQKTEPWKAVTLCTVRPFKKRGPYICVTFQTGYRVHPTPIQSGGAHYTLELSFDPGSDVHESVCVPELLIFCQTHLEKMPGVSWRLKQHDFHRSMSTYTTTIHF